MDCAKSIDELYDEVKDYDLVITNDAALATALNGRVDKPIIGYFAMTPHSIAREVGPMVISEAPYSDLRTITTISEEIGLNFRYVHSELENIREIRNYTASVDSYLYTRNAHSIWESYMKIPSMMMIMSRFDPQIHRFFDDYRKIAVIGLDFFNDLDKHFIPIDFDEIDPFKHGEFNIETIYEIGNDRQIADNAADLIDPEHATDYAIVLNSESALTDAVRSALYRRNIPFKNKMKVRDLTQIRDYVQFLNMSLSFRTTRVRQVRELLLSYNVYVDQKKDKFLLEKLLAGKVSDNTRPVLEMMRDIRKYTFGEIVDNLGHSGTAQVRMILGQMDLEDKQITSQRVSDLTYAVNNVSELRHNEEVPEYEKNGVLITDCKNNVYVDRPVVLYLGMEQDWNIPVVGKKYLDVEAETEKNVMRLKILLQQGKKRVYLVNTTKNGRTARPALNFDQIVGEAADSFSKICDNLVSGRWHAQEPVPQSLHEEMQLDSGDEFRSSFSKSTFDAYIDCPRKFMFKVLIPTPDEKTTEFGNLLHEFAELYACYPEVVMNQGIDAFVKIISDEYSGLSSSLMEPMDNERIRIAIRNIIRFVDKHGFHDLPLDVNNKLRNHRNTMMEALGLDISSSACESEQRPRNIPIYGYLDVYSDGVIYDYKTGKAKDTTELVNMMDLDSKEKYVDFQPLFYLAMVADHPDDQR